MSRRAPRQGYALWCQTSVLLRRWARKPQPERKSWVVEVYTNHLRGMVLRPDPDWRLIDHFTGQKHEYTVTLKTALKLLKRERLGTTQPCRARNIVTEQVITL